MAHSPIPPRHPRPCRAQLAPAKMPSPSPKSSGGFFFIQGWKTWWGSASHPQSCSLGWEWVVQPLRHWLVPGHPETAGMGPSPAVGRCKCIEIRWNRCCRPCPGEISPGKSRPSPDFRRVTHVGAMVNMPQALLEEAAATSPGSDLIASHPHPPNPGTGKGQQQCSLAVRTGNPVKRMASRGFDVDIWGFGALSLFWSLCPAPGWRLCQGSPLFPSCQCQAVGCGSPYIPPAP